MNEGVVIINRGTSDCQVCIKWIKQQAPDMIIRSVSLDNDPYLNRQQIERIVQEEGIEHYYIPFSSSFISLINQNRKKAWDFERELKGLQYQKSLLIHNNMRSETLHLECSGNMDIEFTHLVTTLRNTDYDNKILELVDKFQSCLTKMSKISKDGIASTGTIYVKPLDNVSNDDEFQDFLLENNIIL